jgi:8-oxo-dGTP pyrophosphatase MutT (NUDIX family)
MRPAAAGGAAAARVVPVAALELAYEPRQWEFAQARRREIDAHFAALRRERPQLWNGRVLLLHRAALADRAFRGAYLETDFASFVAWRDWGFPSAAMHNCFGMGAVRGSDGGFILGRMSAHTANAGRIYFPSGTPDPDDIVDGAVDLEGSVRRELEEETGLTAADVTADPGWCTVFAGPRIAQMKLFRAADPAPALRARILERLARVPQPELADILIVRSRADFDALMPPFVTAFLEHVWAQERAQIEEPKR